MVLNFLTLDWDYFFTASEELRQRCFQIYRTENAPAHQHIFSWAYSYYDFGEELLNIKIKPEAYDILKKIKLNRSAEVYICKSHTNAYHVFSSFLQKYRKTPRINLLNIDHHSDTLHEIKGLYSLQDTGVHCGNWLYCFMKQAKGNYWWVCDEDSEKIALPSSLKFCTDIKDAPLESLKWAAVLICRSDIWSPPHLDDEFTKIFMPYIQSTYSFVMDADIWQSRYPAIRKLADEIIEYPPEYSEKQRKECDDLKEVYLQHRKQVMDMIHRNQEKEKEIRKSHPELFK